MDEEKALAVIRLTDETWWVLVSSTDNNEPVE